MLRIIASVVIPMRAAAFAAVALTMLGGAAAHAEILIAVAGPLTGQALFRGEQMQQGAEMAVADINRAGGVLGQRLELIYADDACDPEQAVAVAKKLVADRAAIVAGHACSHSSIPASKVYEAARVLMISPASTNPRLTDEGGDNIFRVCGRDDQQGIVAGDYLADAWDGRRIAILHDGTTYGRGLADETRKQLRKRGVSETMFEAYVPGLRDYAQLVEKLQAARIDAVYIGGYSAEAGLIIRQARDRSYGVQMVSGDALTTDEFWMIAGPAGNGTRVTFGPDPRRNQAAASVVGRLRDRGFEPKGYTLHTYAAIQAWAQAVRRAGSVDVNAVIAALRRGRFETVLGKIGFDEKGDVTAPGYVWYIWQNGKYAPVSEQQKR